jgi:predicted dehydrogenase
MIRVAFLGRSGHAYRALQALPQTDDARLVAYCPMPPEEPDDLFDGWKADGKLGDAKGYSTYQELIDAEKPDLVQVSGAYYQNGVAAAYAAERGCHVHVEKPIATTLGQLAKLKAAVDSGGVRLTAMLDSRLDPACLAVKKIVDAGGIGEPVLVYAQKSYKFGNSRPEWYASREKYGGSIPWIAIHAIDWINYFLRDPFASVVAHHASFVACAQRAECEDVMSMHFELRNGGAAAVNGDYLNPPGAASHGDDRIRIVGTQGTVEILRGKATLADADGERELPLVPNDDCVFLNFVRSLAHGDEHVLGPMDAFRSTEVALRARDSADRGGERIDLTETEYRS